MGRQTSSISGRRVAVVATAGALLVLGLLPLIKATTLVESTPLDLQIYLQAARAGLRGADLYSSPVVQAPGATGNFTYPPFAALAFTPLSVLPDRWAAIVWLLGTVVGLVLLVALSARAITSRVNARWRPIAVALMTLACLYTLPVSSSINYGQVGVLICLMLVVDTTRTGRWRGVLVGLATAIKLTPGLFILYFALTRQWRAAATALATVAICWSATAVVLTEASRTYLLSLLDDSLSRIVADWTYVDNQSLFGTVGRLGWDGRIWGALAAGAVVLGLWRAKNAHQLGNDLAAATLVGLTTLLVSPISWIHHAIWLVPALGVLLGAGASRPRVFSTILVWAYACIFPINQLAPGSMEPGLPPPSGLTTVLAEGFVLLYLTLLAFLPIRLDGRPSARGGADVPTHTASPQGDSPSPHPD